MEFSSQCLHCLPSTPTKDFKQDMISTVMCPQTWQIFWRLPECLTQTRQKPRSSPSVQLIATLRHLIRLALLLHISPIRGPHFANCKRTYPKERWKENSFSVSFHRALNGTFGHCLGANMTHDLAPFLLFRGTFSYGRALHASRVPLPRLG